MKNNKQIIKLLTPSWLVNFLGVAIGVLATAAVIIITKYQASALRFQVFDVQSRSIVDQQKSVYATITLDHGKTSFIGALPLLITWACVGLAVYFLAMTLYKGISRVADLREQMEYVNASKQAIKHEAYIAFGIRLFAAVGWFVLLKLTISVLVPYALASASAAAVTFNAQSLLYGAIAVLLLYATTYGHAIFLRLVLLKPRVFGG